jgi:hypothetical protein
MSAIGEIGQDRAKNGEGLETIRKGKAEEAEEAREVDEEGQEEGKSC